MNHKKATYYSLFSKVKIYLIFYFGISPFTNIYNNDIGLRVQQYTTEEGLSQNYIDCIYRDSRDFVWVGTWDGLNRFDGYNFITYRPDKRKNSISNGFINAITEDKNGDLWIATRNGINKYIFDTEEFIHFIKDTSRNETSISDDWVSSLLFDNENNLWIGTLSAGIEKITFDESLSKIISIQRFNVNFLDNKSITSGNIYCLIQDHEGYIFIGSILGLDRLDPKTGIVSKYTDINHPFYFPATVVHSLFEDSKHILWIGTEGGLLSIDHKYKKLSRYNVDRISPPGTNKNALSHGLVKSVGEDGHGKILVGTLGGLHIFDKSANEFTLFPEGLLNVYNLNNKFINCIYSDKGGNVWIGTEKGGVNKYNIYQKHFHFYVNEPDNLNSLNNNIINSVNEDDDFLWIGTAGGGLNRYNKRTGKFTHYTHNHLSNSSISSNYISAIACKNNEVWIGTWGRGINQTNFSKSKDEMTFKTYLYNPQVMEGPPYIYISDLIFDDDNNLWIGRPEGLQLYNKKNDTFYYVEPGSAFGNQINNISCLYIDSKNQMWVGTTIGLRMFKLKKGLSPEELCKPDSIFNYKHDPNDSLSLKGDFIVTILEDKTGSMWFSVYGNGICRLNKISSNSLDVEFSSYTIDDGLSNNVVYGILEDKKNNLWLSTDKGLTKFNYPTRTSTSYYETDGLQGNQFYWSAFHKSKDDIMYFGGTKGLNYFNPDSIISNPFQPKVVITDFKLFNQSQHISNVGKGKLSKTISKTSVIELNYNENIISFEFSSLSYISPEKNQYKYKMEGFENDWTYTTADRRYVTYTNLNPGTYYFKVMGSNNDGIWNETPASVKLIINPPWWGTLWFRILFVIFILSVFISIYYGRIRSLQKKRIELEKLVKERTSELNESNKNLKTINETKDKLFTIIAHDLKNPFNVILGMFDILVKNYDKYDDKRKKEMLTAVSHASQNLYKLLDNLLQWSKSQIGKLEFKPESFNINELVLNNIDLVEGQIDKKRIKISFNNIEETMVYADVNLTNIILRNLLNNAIKFTKEGTISISIDKPEQDNYIRVNIKDSGVGIENSRLKDIFSIGGIQSTKGTDGENGSGLGLILCREFVEKNGGTIWVESQKGKGSTFIFTLPVSKKSHRKK